MTRYETPLTVAFVATVLMVAVSLVISRIDWPAFALAMDAGWLR